jgi:protein-S-isoprenylcysteine O-methyltransferase Ste14
MYLGAIIFCLGFFLANISMWNGIIFSFIVMAEITRIINEEEFFAKDEEYQKYKAKVRWRLIPYVF